MNKGLFSDYVKQNALAANQVETVISLLSGTVRTLEVVRWGVSFSGVSPTDAPVVVDLYRPGSQAGSQASGQPIKLNPNSDATTTQVWTTFDTEPTVGEIMESFYVTPYGGLFVMQYAPDERPIVIPNNRIGIRCLAAAAVNVTAFMIYTE